MQPSRIHQFIVTILTFLTGLDTSASRAPRFTFTLSRLSVGQKTDWALALVNIFSLVDCAKIRNTQFPSPLQNTRNEWLPKSNHNFVKVRICQCNPLTSHKKFLKNPRGAGANIKIIRVLLLHLLFV